MSQNWNYIWIITYIINRAILLFNLSFYKKNLEFVIEILLNNEYLKMGIWKWSLIISIKELKTWQSIDLKLVIESNNNSNTENEGETIKNIFPYVSSVTNKITN